MLSPVRVVKECNVSTGGFIPAGQAKDTFRAIHPGISLAILNNIPGKVYQYGDK